jgi:hypothetical protein
LDNFTKKSLGGTKCKKSIEMDLGEKGYGDFSWIRLVTHKPQIELGLQWDN